ncbi:hypothetical protein ACFW6E_13970 [Streptomyces olivaceoviridis]|uniref:hypothetical protein n=1 Tax=Streptomyces olivaceoviridis TaxID=1921 RepID=UPI0036B6BDAA
MLALVGADPAARHIGGRAVRHLAEVCVYCEEVSGPELMDDALHRAVRAALTDRGAASLVVPRHVLAAPAPGAPPAARPVPPPPRPPAAKDLRRAADVLDGAGKAVVVVGNAGRPASRQVVEVARLLGAGVATTGLARDALPDDLPCLAGVAGPLGSEAAATLLGECDTLLLAGAEDLDPAVLPGPGRCRIVAVDREPDDCPLEGGAPAVRVTGDVTACLEALAPLLRPPPTAPGAPGSSGSSGPGGTRGRPGPAATSVRR